jgi:hypothetical protein
MTDRAAKQLASQLVPQPAAAGVQPAQPGDPKLTMLREALGFLSGQHPAYLTLWAVLISLGACMWFGGQYVVNTAIPAHLASIKQGYQELWDKHMEDKQQTERQHREHMDQIVHEMRHSNQLLDTLLRELVLQVRARDHAASGSPEKQKGGGQ